ncbi:hypothetical protein MKK58_20015 [Methylobacterium sp. J-078]|jgi:hypothetical protein|uniref:hypothetical protein n=1 Tax=Methylobacterium sp. J-078 TaxID=2836657 RepID=UPI001FB972D4|nr:hypothetical protein [Methylobacterium sp. J-078]MCJ2046804.1 hypothetical protein [Methylobacterium sp. J-078]
MATVTRAPLVVRTNKRGSNDRNSRLAHHGWFNYWRTETSLAYRGTLAFEFLTLAAVHPSVRDIRQHAEPVWFWNGGDWEEYRPRYELVLATDLPGVTRRVDVEVLSSVELRQERLKYRRIARECRKEGRRFLVFTERQVHAESRLTNAELVLTQAGEGLVSDHDLEQVRQAVDEGLSLTLNGLVAKGVLQYPRAYAAVLNLVARGEISFRPSRRFDGNTPLLGRS